MRSIFTLFISIIIFSSCSKNEKASLEKKQPNFIVIYTDDQRHDAYGFHDPRMETPTIDKLAKSGIVFTNAHVAHAVCGPSRAAFLSGQYGSTNGVIKFGSDTLKRPDLTIAQYLKEAGYATGQTGKWHLKNTPNETGFDFFATCYGNGPYYGRRFFTNGDTLNVEQYIEDYITENSIKFIESNKETGKPFFLYHCTQIPHMNHEYDWNVKMKTYKNYLMEKYEMPLSYDDSLETKPDYLKTSRSRMRAINKYGYGNPDSLKIHMRKYFASITEMDASLGKLISYLEENNLMENTYIMFMGDNGWFLGEHKFTSKVLAYEESFRVPFIMTGPELKHAINNEFVMNIDLAPTILDIAGIERKDVHEGFSLKPILDHEKEQVRDYLYYEAQYPQLGTRPSFSIKDKDYKYIRTYTDTLGTVYEELYDMKKDSTDMVNLLAENPEMKEKTKYSQLLDENLERFKPNLNPEL